MTKLNVGGMQINIDAMPTAATAIEDDRLDRQATACCKVGDWEGAIAALRQRKDLAAIAGKVTSWPSACSAPDASRRQWPRFNGCSITASPGRTCCSVTNPARRSRSRTPPTARACSRRRP